MITPEMVERSIKGSAVAGRFKPVTENSRTGDARLQLVIELVAEQPIPDEAIARATLALEQIGVYETQPRTGPYAPLVRATWPAESER